MKNLIQKIISGVILEEYTLQRTGTYSIKKYVGVSNGARNRPDGYWEHIWEKGGPYSNDSFYGLHGEAFPSAEEAARIIINRRGIVGVDAHNRAIIKKKVEQ